MKFLQNNTELTSMHNRSFGNIIYIVIMEKDSQLSIIQKVITWRIWPGNSTPSTSIFGHTTARPQTEGQTWHEMMYLSVYWLPTSQWKEFQTSWWQGHLGIMESWQSFTYKKYNTLTSVGITLIKAILLLRHCWQKVQVSSEKWLCTSEIFPVYLFLLGFSRMKRQLFQEQLNGKSNNGLDSSL